MRGLEVDCVLVGVTMRNTLTRNHSFAQPCSTGWQFNRIFRPPNRLPNYGRRPKNDRLLVGDELGDDLGLDLGGLKILLNCHPGWQFNRLFGRLNHGLNHGLNHRLVL